MRFIQSHRGRCGNDSRHFICGADQWPDRFGLALVFEKCISILFWSQNSFEFPTHTTIILTVAFGNSAELAGEIKLIELFWLWQLISLEHRSPSVAKTHGTRRGLAKWKIIIQVAPLGCSLALWKETPTHPRTQREFHANLFDFLACPRWRWCYWVHAFAMKYMEIILSLNLTCHTKLCWSWLKCLNVYTSGP